MYYCNATLTLVVNNIRLFFFLFSLLYQIIITKVCIYMKPSFNFIMLRYILFIRFETKQLISNEGYCFWCARRNNLFNTKKLNYPSPICHTISKYIFNYVFNFIIYLITYSIRIYSPWNTNLVKSSFYNMVVPFGV